VTRSSTGTRQGTPEAVRAPPPSRARVLPPAVRPCRNGVVTAKGVAETIESQRQPA
jgi:hypothetical protein